MVKSKKVYAYGAVEDGVYRKNYNILQRIKYDLYLYRPIIINYPIMYKFFMAFCK